MRSRSLATIFILVLVGAAAILASKLIGNRLGPDTELIASRFADDRAPANDPAAGMFQMDKATKGARITIDKPTDNGAGPAGSVVE